MIDCSVIIPNYNQGHLIRRAIESAINQDYPYDRYEIIIVDDGSTDDSLEKIDLIILENTFSSSLPLIRVLTKENGGVSSARNLGIASVNKDCKYIAFLDSDDEYMKNKLSRSVEELNRYPQVGCVYSDYTQKSDTESTKTYKHSFDFSLLLQNCIVSTNSVVLKEAMDKIGEYDETLQNGEDYDIWMRIANAGYMIRHIPEFLFNYYLHGDNQTLTADPMKQTQNVATAQNRANRGEYYVRN